MGPSAEGLRKAGSSLAVAPIRAALVGTGYIGDFHARAIQLAPHTDLVAVCDSNLSRARAFARRWRVPSAYDSLEAMLRSENVECAHVLLPPDLHYSAALSLIEARVNVYVEKPFTVSTEEADELLRRAAEAGVRLGVNHNLTYSAAFQRLREVIAGGALGPLDHVSVRYFLELGPIRFGPFDSWMLREPGNPLLEIGPHLFSFVNELVGPLEKLVAVADRPARLPGKRLVFRRWRVQGVAGRVAVDMALDLGPGFCLRSIDVHGLLGSATVDLDADTCVVDRARTAANVDVDTYVRTRARAAQLGAQARQAISDVLLTRLRLRSRGNPYEKSFLDAIAAFYRELQSESPLDRRLDARSGRDVIDLCQRVIRLASVGPLDRAPAPRYATVRPTVLVLGGSGFIGRALVRHLLDAGYGVRTLLRGSTAALDGLDGRCLEIVLGDVRRERDLADALSGIEHVYHLARAGAAKTWEDYLQDEIEPTRLIGEACLRSGVKRLVYAGTIDSYYAGARAGRVTEQTPLDRHIKRRNYYARAKAASEDLLLSMHRGRSLPLVIFRPGIVIGQGGNPFHWGVGLWNSPGSCQVWGDGTNKLPFVLVADVAAALVRGIQVDGIEGRSYNLVDAPLLSAREYVDEYQRLSGLVVTSHHSPIWRFYALDMAKWALKIAARHPDRRMPSYRDWESRTQKALFDCQRARHELGWSPASDRQRMVEEGIGESLRAWLAAWR